MTTSSRIDDRAALGALSDEANAGSSSECAAKQKLGGVVRPNVVGHGSKFRMRRKHVLMLVLAVEVLILGARGAERYRPPGIAVDWPATEGHRIT